VPARAHNTSETGGFSVPTSIPAGAASPGVPTSEGRTELLRKILCGIAASALVALLPGMAMAQTSAARPVDPPQQVAQLRQQYEGLIPNPAVYFLA
jgi:hypothetical protein